MSKKSNRRPEVKQNEDLYEIYVRTFIDAKAGNQEWIHPSGDLDNNLAVAIALADAENRGIPIKCKVAFATQHAGLLKEAGTGLTKTLTPPSRHPFLRPDLIAARQ